MRKLALLQVCLCLFLTGVSADCSDEIALSINTTDPADPGSYICTCPAGRYDTQDNVCTACSTGTYKPSIGSQACTACNSEDTASVLFATSGTGFGATSKDQCRCKYGFVDTQREGDLWCTCPAGKSWSESLRQCKTCVDVNDAKDAPGMYDCYACPDYLHREDAASCAWHTSNVCEDPSSFNENSDESTHDANHIIPEKGGAIPLNLPLQQSQATFLAYYIRNTYCGAFSNFGSVRMEINGGTLTCTYAYANNDVQQRTETQKSEIFNRRLSTTFNCNLMSYDTAICAEGYTPDLYQDTFGNARLGCIPCPSGEGYIAGLIRDTCVECPAGTYANTSTKICTPCPPGTYQTTPGQTSCTACKAHHYNYLEGQMSSVACLDCPQNLLQPSTGSSSVQDCKPCPYPMRVAHAGFDRWCQPCQPGWQRIGLECQACPIGSYRAAENAPNCTACPPGTTTNGVGKTSPLDCVCAENTSACCNPGQEYNFATGECQACPIQTFQGQIGAHPCQTCPEGTVAAPANKFCYCSEPSTIAGHCQPYGEDYPFGLRRKSLNANWEWISSENTIKIMTNTDDTELFHLLSANFTIFMQKLATYAIGCPEMVSGGEHYLAVIETQSGGSPTIGIYCHPYDYYHCLEENNVELMPDDAAWQDFETVTIIKNSTGACMSSSCGLGYEADEFGFCQCAPGYGKSADEACEPCPVDSFQPSRGLAACMACPAHSLSPAGSTRCHCTAGSVWTSDSECHMCEAGKFASYTGVEECRACRAGTFSLWNASQCLLCDAGFYSELSASSCQGCAAGFFSSSHGSGNCAACAAGKFSRGNASQCLLCDAGFFSELSASSCQGCAAGFFSSSEGSANCTACAAGKYSRGNASQCLLCDAGFFSELSASSCQGCAAGFFSSSEGSGNCAACAPGKYSQGNASQCLLCEAGFYSEATASSCQGCAAGFFSSSHGSGNCSACAAGKYSEGNASLCLACGAGLFSVGSASTCSRCQAGFQVNSEKNNCAPCQAGKFSALGMDSCQACQNGTVSNGAGSGACSACTAGSEPDAEQDFCAPCQAGKFSALGMDSCQACQNGTVSNGVGSAACSACTAGSEPDAEQNFCAPCQAGKFSALGMDSCQACQNGTVSNGVGSAACSSCPPGSEPDPQQNFCAPCQAGKFSALGMDSCQACQHGKFSNGPNATVCSACAAGSEPDAEQQFCIPCSAGTYRAGEMENCAQCLHNTFSTPRAAECAPCPSGHVARQNKTSCQPCSPGTFLANGTHDLECQACTANTFQPKFATTTCLDCPPGTRSEGSSCKACPSGQFLNATTQRCEACPEGWYAKVNALTIICERIDEPAKFAAVATLIAKSAVQNDSAVIIQAIRPGKGEGQIAEMDAFLFINEGSEDMQNFKHDLVNGTYEVVVTKVVRELRRRVLLEEAQDCTVRGCRYFVQVREHQNAGSGNARRGGGGGSEVSGGGGGGGGSVEAAAVVVDAASGSAGIVAAILVLVGLLILIGGFCWFRQRSTSNASGFYARL